MQNFRPRGQFQFTAVLGNLAYNLRKSLQFRDEKNLFSITKRVVPDPLRRGSSLSEDNSSSLTVSLRTGVGELSDPKVLPVKVLSVELKFNESAMPIPC
jgi:hypothetical protein